MSRSIRQNKNLNPKEFVKAYMTQPEIQGLEAAQGHFTSIDTKTGLREFSHLIPLFKHHHVLNLFENLEKQLSDLGDLDEFHKIKYKEAAKHLRPYRETPAETVMKKYGRGKDKHLVLLPKSIADFFIECKGGSTTRNPKTGYLEFGRNGPPSRSSGTNFGNQGRGGEYSPGVIADYVTGGHRRNASGVLHVDVEGHKFRPHANQAPSVNRSSGSGIYDEKGGFRHPSGHYTPAEELTGRLAYPDRTDQEWLREHPAGRPDPNSPEGESFGAYRKKAGIPDYIYINPMSGPRYINSRTGQGSNNIYEWGGVPVPAASPPPAPQAAPAKPSALASALQYGGTILGHLLGGPLGGQLASMLGAGINGQFNPSDPTRAATEVAKQGFASNPLLSLLTGHIGNKIADQIPQNPQQALTQYLAGNLNYAAPGSNQLFKPHWDDHGSHTSQINQMLESNQLSPDFLSRLLPKNRYSPVQSVSELKQKTSLRPSVQPNKNQTFTEPFDKMRQKIKLDQELSQIDRSTFPQIEEGAISTPPHGASAPSRLSQISHAPLLSQNQKNKAIQEYEQKNPTNSNNPFEVREDEDRLLKNAYREYYKTHGRESNRGLSGD